MSPLDAPKAVRTDAERLAWLLSRDSVHFFLCHDRRPDQHKFILSADWDRRETNPDAEYSWEKTECLMSMCESGDDLRELIDKGMDMPDVSSGLPPEYWSAP